MDMGLLSSGLVAVAGISPEEDARRTSVLMTRSNDPEWGDSPLKDPEFHIAM